MEANAQPKCEMKIYHKSTPNDTHADYIDRLPIKSILRKRVKTDEMKNKS